MLGFLEDRRAVARFLTNLRCYDQANIERALINAMGCSPDEAARLATEARDAITKRTQEG